MNNELVLIESAMSIEQVVKQRELIKSAMKSAMEEGVHYGKIPGCGDKPSLMQSGAQLLAHLFKVRPEYEITEVAFEAEHREYRILCKLMHIASGMEVGQGVGICSTRESKYRYRNEAKEVTWLDEPVPHVYWNLRKKPDDLKRWLQTIFGDRDISIIGTKKNDQGQWYFVEYHGGDGKVENPNIADVFNTVLKIAKKRAFVDATITVTASNDLFTQDLEDIAENLRTVDAVTKETIAATETKSETPGEGKSEPGKKRETLEPEKKAKTQAEKIRAAEADQKASWRNVRVHIGTPGGKVKDRELGTMAFSTLEWIEKQMITKTGTITKQDEALIEALKEWRASLSDLSSSNIGKALEMLRVKCEAMKISLAAIVAVNKKLSDGTVEVFVQIPDDQAKYMLDNWEETLKLAQDEMDQLPQ